MEVAVAEEKKKIFRARKTMKISDRQQLESLHSTLSSPAPTQLNPSPPPAQTPLVNGTHTADGQKGAGKEQNDTEKKSSRSTTPSSQASRSPPLMLTLSLSPSSSQSSNAKEGTPPSPPSPFHSLNSELKKMEEEGRKDRPVSPSNETGKGQSKEMTAKMEDKKKEEKEATGTKKEEMSATTEDRAVDSAKDSQSSAVSPGTSSKESGKDKGTKQDDIVAMETDKDNTENKAREEKSCPPKVTTTAVPKATKAAPNLSHTSAPKADQDKKEEEEEEGEKDDKQKAKEGVMARPDKKMKEKMEVETSVKKDIKVKAQVHAEFNSTSSHPSSTSSSATVLKDEKGTVSGLKRPKPEGNAKVEREGKRQRVDDVALEAQLELKITANAGEQGSMRLEKFVHQLVSEKLRVLELTVFDQNLQDLKERVNKIDNVPSRQQSVINTLQAKIARLAKKFEKANQALETPKKQEQVPEAPVAKPAPMTPTTPTQRVLRRQPLEMQSGVQRERRAPSVGRTPRQSIEKEEETEEEEDDEEEEEEEEEAEKPPITQRQQPVKKQQDNRGSPRPDIVLRPLSKERESQLYYSCKTVTGKARVERYAVYLFRNIVPYGHYLDWVNNVNYVGHNGKDALPFNLRETMKMHLQLRFNNLYIGDWRKIRDSINELLRVKRSRLFFTSK